MLWKRNVAEVEARFQHQLATAVEALKWYSTVSTKDFIQGVAITALAKIGRQMSDQPKPTAGELLPEFEALGFKRKIDQSTTSEWTADADGVLLPLHRFIGQYAKEIAEAHNAAVQEAYEKGKQDGVREHYVGK